MKRYFPLIITLSIFSGQCLYAQNDTLVQVVRKVFYEKKVYDRIFFDYTAGEIDGYPYMPSGRYALIFSDSIFQKKYPGLLEKLAISHGTVGVLLSIPFIKEQEGEVWVTSHTLDDRKDLFITFDHLSFSDRESKLVFHTTSWTDKSMKGKYVKVTCSLKRKNDEWRISTLKIDMIPCCDMYMFGGR